MFGVLERGGEVRARPIASLGLALKEVRDNVKDGATVMTDNWPAYRPLAYRFDHHVVHHSKAEYVCDGYIHINSLEGYGSQLKRQIYGIHHWVSAKHLHRYIDESVFRYNRREVGKAPRFAEFLNRTDGRLTYNVLIGKA